MGMHRPNKEPQNGRPVISPFVPPSVIILSGAEHKNYKIEYQTETSVVDISRC